MRRIYQGMSFAHNTARLLGSVLRREVDPAWLWFVAKSANGTSVKECPICNFTGLFKPCGNPPRWDAQCPSCDSLERNRLFAVFLRSAPSFLTKGAAVLHFAPENSMRMLLQRPDINYTTADLLQTDVHIRLNIEDIDIADEQYDVIVCSHVLEHVNDKAALAELYRILKTGGVLIIMVPIIDGCDVTYEDDTITDSRDRLIHFGKEDHVRVYGSDFITRVIGAGFHVRTHAAFGKEAVKFGLAMGEKIFLCTKPAREPVHGRLRHQESIPETEIGVKLWETPN